MAGHEENDWKKPFQVVDRRRFDSDGNEKDGRQLAGDTPVSPVHLDSSVTTKSEGASMAELNIAPSGGDEGQEMVHEFGNDEDESAAEYRPEASENPEEDVTLTSFIMSLATQTMVQLGEMDPPSGMEIPVDVEAARQTIDIISMIQRKTKSNLSADESRFIVEVLHTLRMSYVRQAK